MNHFFTAKHDKTKTIENKTNIETKIETILTLEQTSFLSTLNDKELKSYYIAKSHLVNSFEFEKSNCFIEWKKKTKPN